METDSSQHANETAPRNSSTRTAGSSDSFDKIFQTWEKRTSDYFEKLMRNPSFLNAMGGVMSFGFRNKAQFDRAMAALWKNLNLPNKADQERVLHLLNELHSRIHDLEDKIATLTEENERLRAKSERGL